MAISLDKELRSLLPKGSKVRGMSPEYRDKCLGEIRDGGKMREDGTWSSIESGSNAFTAYAHKVLRLLTAGDLSPEQILQRAPRCRELFAELRAAAVKEGKLRTVLEAFAEEKHFPQAVESLYRVLSAFPESSEKPAEKPAGKQRKTG